MSKSDFSWILVRVLGAFLIYQGVAVIYGATVAWINIKDAIEDLPRLRQEILVAPIYTLFFNSFLPLILGIYLTFYGRLLHGLLMSVPSEFVDYSSIPGAVRGIDLPEPELEQFKGWLEKNSEFACRAPVDQLALFRDAQAAERRRLSE